MNRPQVVYFPSGQLVYFPSGVRRPRFPSPEEPPTLTVPPDERVRLDHRQERAPLQQACEQDEDDSRRRIRPSRLDAALLVERQLLPEKQVFRRQLRSRRQRKAGKRNDIAQKAADRGRP